MKFRQIAASAAMLIASAVIASANPFSDVPASHWAHKEISKMTERGIIQGYPDNTFKGDTLVTRYQLALITAKIVAAMESQGPNNFSKEDIATVDKLTSEFSEELALIGVKTTTLVEDMQQLKDDVASIKNTVDAYKEAGRKENAIKLAGDFLIRNTNIVEKNGDPAYKVHRMSTQLRLKMTAQVAENVKAVARWVMINDNHTDTGVAGESGAGWTGSNFKTSYVDQAYLVINDMFSFGGDFTFGRRSFAHGHNLMLNTKKDAVSYNKLCGKIDLNFNLFFDKQEWPTGSCSTHNTWNINVDTDYRGHKLYLGIYRFRFDKEFLNKDFPVGAANRFTKNTSETAVEFGSKGDLGNNGYWSYDLGGVYQIQEEGKRFESETDSGDVKGWTTYAALKWDSKQAWAGKVAYTMIDENSACYEKYYSMDKQYSDGPEHPLEDILRASTYDNAYSVANLDRLITNISDLKVQFSYSPKKSKHYFRFAYDIVKPKSNSADSYLFNKGVGNSNKADVTTVEYRYQLATNTRIRIGGTYYKYGNGIDVNQVGTGDPHRDYKMYWAEIFSRF